jgi:predicted enzyme related to lactoylglutathione lyase
MGARMAGLFQIDYIEFPSSNGARSREFFGQAFGWRFTNYGPTYDGIEDAGIDAGIDHSKDRPESILAVVRTSDLEAAERGVIEAGGIITRPAFDFPGGRRFHFREPGGNELAVWVASE